jgi:CheY-like chemotaxis protein
MQIQKNAQTLRDTNSAQLSSLKALVVDDNANARDINQQVIAGFGLQVEVASSGREAISMIQEHAQSAAFDMVFMDWKMPEMDGIQTVQQIQEQGFDLDVIMVTAFGRDELTKEADVINIDAVLTKPVTPSHLFDTIVQVRKIEVFEQTRREVQQQGANLDIAQLQGANILVAEDNDVNQELITELLKSNGINCTVCDDGAQAVEYLKQNEVDGVLMDCQMPVMDGYTATKVIRHQLGLKEIPVIALTANALAGDREKAIEAGMNDHIPKPINVNSLFSTMAKWITPASPNAVTQSGDLVKVVNEQDLVLPEFGGLDTEVGLANAADNKALYLKLIGKFASEDNTPIDDLNAAYSEERIDDLQRIAHTIKGVTATLGAQEVSDLAAVLEQQAEDKAVQPKSIEALGRELLPLQQSLQEFVTQRDTSEVSEADNSQNVSDEDMLAFLQQLAQLLDDFDGESNDYLNSHDCILQTFPAQAKKLQTLIEEYDYEAAGEIVQEMQQQVTKNA